MRPSEGSLASNLPDSDNTSSRADGGLRSGGRAKEPEPVGMSDTNAYLLFIVAESIGLRSCWSRAAGMA